MHSKRGKRETARNCILYLNIKYSLSRQAQLIRCGAAAAAVGRGEGQWGRGGTSATAILGVRSIRRWPKESRRTPGKNSLHGKNSRHVRKPPGKPQGDSRRRRRSAPLPAASPVPRRRRSKGYWTLARRRRWLQNTQFDDTEEQQWS